MFVKELIDEQTRRVLAEELERYGLPTTASLAALLRHIYGNRDTVYAAKDKTIELLEHQNETLRSAMWDCKSAIIPNLEHVYRTCNAGSETKCFLCTALAHFFDAGGVMYEEQMEKARRA